MPKGKKEFYEGYPRPKKEKRQDKTDTSTINAQTPRRNIIADLLMRGDYSYREMREIVMAKLDMKTYSLRTVKLDVDAVRKEWKDNRLQDMDIAMGESLRRLARVERNAWNSWELSTKEYDKKKTKQKGIPKQQGSSQQEVGAVITEIEQSKESVRAIGDPRFLDIVMKVNAERNKLLGIYAPEKKDLKLNTFADWLMETGKNDKQQG